MDNIDLLSIGDASLDVFLTPTESETFCKVDSHKSLLCFTYGDKIPVKNLSTSIGGNAANNAVGTKRLGINSAVVLTLGSDDVGNGIEDTLKKEGVNTDFANRQKNSFSNHSTIISVAGERTIFTFKVPRDYVFPDNLPKTKWVYLTSLGERFDPLYTKFLSWAKENKETKLAFNPGSRQLRAGVDSFKNILSVSYIIYVNRKEAERITGLNHTHGKEKDLLNALCKLGPIVPIVTEGPDGAFAFDGKNYYKVGILPVDAHERTGAGDAFGSGCLAALIKGKTLKEALLWGTANSASVIGYSGAQKGLLKENELKLWLDRCKSSGIEVKDF